MENTIHTNKLNVLLATVIVWLFAIIQPIHAQETAWVIDETNDLTTETLNHITSLNEVTFAGFDIEPQFAIEILQSIPEEYADIDEYRNERFKELGVGNSQHDSGILFVIDLQERMMGIETGYGVEAIVRDIEASQIIDGEVKQYLGSYMDSSNPEDLNNAIMQATNEIEVLLTKGNSGVLFEEREAEQERLLAQQQEKAQQAGQLKENLVSTGLGIVAGITSIVVGIASLFGLSSIIEKHHEKKRKQTKEAVVQSYLQYYEQEMDPLIKEELPKDQFETILKSNYENYYKKYPIKYSLVDYIAYREDILNDIREEYYAIFIQENKQLKLEPAMYLNRAKEFREEIKSNSSYTIHKHITLIEKEYEIAQANIKKYNSQLRNMIEQTVTAYKKKESGYSADVFSTSIIYSYLVNQYNLNEKGIINNTYQFKENKVVQKHIERVLRARLVEDVMENEFANVSFGHGNRKGFLTKALGASVGIMTFLSRDQLIHYIKDLLSTYRSEEEKKEKERILLAERRRREERRQREEQQRRAARRAAHSIRSSSSGGSFGSGFGGGSSGGGGASGGF